MHLKLGLPPGSNRTQHASYVMCEERLENFFRELRKTGSNLGLNQGPLSLAIDACSTTRVYVYGKHVQCMCECDVYTGLYFVQILHTTHSLYICVHAHLCRSEGIPADDTVLQGIMGRVASTPEGKCWLPSLWW